MSDRPLKRVQEVADIVEAEGLGYAVESYLSGKSIADGHLAHLWNEAGAYLKLIRQHLERHAPGGELLSPEPPIYVIQDSRSGVGDCAVWWRPNGYGYTCNMDEAGRFTETEARRIACGRDSDRVFALADVTPLAARHVIVAALLQLPRLERESPEAGGGI